MGMLRRSTLWLGILFNEAAFDPPTSTLDKARAVRQILDRNKEETNNTVDARERGDYTQ
jgi:hypothetical protein